LGGADRGRTAAGVREIPRGLKLQKENRKCLEKFAKEEGIQDGEDQRVTEGWEHLCLPKSTRRNPLEAWEGGNQVPARQGASGRPDRPDAGGRERDSERIFLWKRDK